MGRLLCWLGLHAWGGMERDIAICQRVDCFKTRTRRVPLW